MSQTHSPSQTDFNQSAQFIQAIRERIATVVVGQDVVVERLLISLFTGGHILLQGVPGIAKTLLASALSKAMQLGFSRVQFTIDLLPADILGSEILDPKTGSFRTEQGPIFTNLLLADQDILSATDDLTAAIETAKGPVILVSNEVGWGIVPGNLLARQFRDEAGIVNQIVAKAADEVHLVVAGLVTTLR